MFGGGPDAPEAPKAPIQPKEDSQATTMAAEEERRRRQRLAGTGQGILTGPSGDAASGGARKTLLGQ
jgi:hypothetical protein